jgi:hypothetical protein
MNEQLVIALWLALAFLLITVVGRLARTYPGRLRQRDAKRGLRE